MPNLGLYLSIPFCRAKCSFCNFASGVFGEAQQALYLDRICAEIAASRSDAAALGLEIPRAVESVYFGGGTPSLLHPAAIERLFAALHAEFVLAADAEITVESAPGQIEECALQAFEGAGVNRISLGVQSFVDAEAAAVGRTHTGSICRQEIHRLRARGMRSVGVDLIAGLPLQTAASLRHSVDQAVESGVDHVSLYMLEVDEHSRLGREALAGGRRYGAPALIPEDEVAGWYAEACGWLADAGFEQYEISNFARPGFRSAHNRKYWQRAPYLGFGLDAHSMLRAGAGGLRWANSSHMDTYLRGPLITLDVPSKCASFSPQRSLNPVGLSAAFQEEVFLGLRMVEGIDLAWLTAAFGAHAVATLDRPLEECAEAGLIAFHGKRIRLTPAGRLASNEVFGRLLEDSIADVIPAACEQLA